MSDEIKTAMEAAIGDKMPDTPKELANRLALWIEVAQDANAAKHIIQADGSMADDLFVLLQLVYVYFVLADAYSNSSTALLICKARAHLLHLVVGEFKKRVK